MLTLTERDCADIKDEVLEGRLTVRGMWAFLICLFVISSISVGLAYAVANGDTVGWDTLSDGWHIFFYIEAIVFIFHILVLLTCWANNPISQKVLSVAVVICAYRLTFEPYISILMFSKDEGLYEFYLPIVQVILGCALIFHVVVFQRWVKRLKIRKSNEGIFGKSNIFKVLLPTPVLFFLVTLTGSLFKNDVFGNFELTFMIIIFMIVTFGMMFAICEFIIASYCILRFPSFSVNAPKRKKKQFVKQSKSKKKQKKR